MNGWATLLTFWATLSAWLWAGVMPPGVDGTSSSEDNAGVMFPECPNCRERVSFFRSIRTTAWGSFPCKVCGSILGISFPRRILAGLLWCALFIASMEGLDLYRLGPLWSYLLMGLSFVGVLVLAEKTVLIERRAFTCKGCGYELRGLPEPRCPECGLAFDPSERERILARMADPPPKPGGRRIALVLVVILSAGVIAGLMAYRSSAKRGGGGVAPAVQPKP